jgi:hypothetical protein
MRVFANSNQTRSIMRQTATLITGIALLAACSGDPTAATSAAELQSRVTATGDASFGPAVNRDLATLRRVTASFHQFSKAQAAGWSAKITACMTDPDGAGGMGFHYGNTELIDGTASVDKPELLLYEPDKNGRLSLVAVEYIIPYTAHGREESPPVLFGQPFKRNDTFQLWGLHAWVWKHNPSGMFADWNPTVNCDNTTDIMAMRHQ